MDRLVAIIAWLSATCRLLSFVLLLMATHCALQNDPTYDWPTLQWAMGILWLGWTIEDGLNRLKER